MLKNIAIAILLTIYTIANAYELVRPDIPLANNAVLSIYQDRSGYMWFATYDGLHCFNGKDTEVYRMEPDNDKSLSSNIVVKVASSGTDFIWVSTSMGLNRFSLRDRTVSETYMQFRETYLIASDSNGNTALISNDGCIFVYDSLSHSFPEVAVPWLKKSEVVALWSPEEGKFAVLMRNGHLAAFEIDNSEGKERKTTLRLISRRTISDINVRSAFSDGCRGYFVNEIGEVWAIENHEGKPTLLTTLSDNDSSVSDICAFSDWLYIGFYSGILGRIPKKGGKLETVASDYRIFCLVKDCRQDILWIGTDGYGVFMYCDKQEIFHEMLMSDIPLGIKKPIRGLYSDESGSLWIGTKGDGIILVKDYESFLSPKASSSSNIQRITSADGLGSNEVYSFCRSMDSTLLWIGTAGSGLSYYSYKTGSIGKLEVGMEGRSVHQMCVTGGNTLYLADDGYGLVEIHYDVRNGVPCITNSEIYRFRRNDSDCNDFHALTLENDTTLLLGMKSGYGIIRFNIIDKSYSFLNMESLQSRALGDILCLNVGKEGDILCGSSSGLIRIGKDGHVDKFVKKDGLVNDMIHGVLRGEMPYVWLSTNKGLIQFSPSNSAFHNYSSKDLSIIEFSDDSYYRDPQTGRLFFGGVNGVVWIDPREFLPLPAYSPPLIFETLTLPDASSIRIGECNQVEVPRNTRQITISFIAIDYINGENYEYSYLLKKRSGDKQWHELQKENSVTLSGLAPGRYSLHVRYRGSAIEQTSDEAILEFDVPEPWYASPLAIILYVLFSVGIVLSIILIYKRHYDKLQKTAIARNEEESRKRLEQARIDFFVNITHELCTPLTLINGITEQMKESACKTNEYSNYIEILSDNVRGLRDLVEEILDFRKIEESGFGKVHIRKENISSLLRKYSSSFGEMAHRNRILLTREVPEGLTWNTDKAFFKKIVFNLLSNAMKYTPEGGKVSLTANSEDKYLSLRVRNSGKGLMKEELEAVFDKFRMLDNIYAGEGRKHSTQHGLGLYICKALVESLQGKISASSEEGLYTEFKVTLPLLDVDSSVRVSIPLDNDEDRSPGANAYARDMMTADKETSLPVVLVVDDNKDIRWMMKDALSRSFKVIESANSKEAIDVLQKVTPDLIITDVIMEEKDEGFLFLRNLRADPYRRSIPIVVCSARVSDKDQVEGMASGADAYITKPFSVSVLTATAKRLVSNRNLLKDWFDSPESARTIADNKILSMSDKEFLDKTIGVIKKRISQENFDIETVADEVGLSSRNFYRKFKKISGKPPSEFIKNYRFEYAASLLKGTGMTVLEVMYKVGIKNKSYFYREFSSRYGMTPKDFRRTVS